MRKARDASRRTCPVRILHELLESCRLADSPMIPLRHERVCRGDRTRQAVSRHTSSLFPNRQTPQTEVGSSSLLGATVHPFMDVATEKAPMLPNLRRRQFTDPSKLVHGGLGHTKKAGPVHDRQDLVVR